MLDNLLDITDVPVAVFSTGAVMVIPSRSARPATDMAMVRNWARLTA